MSLWQGKRVLVAGGAGFIGSHLVERLVACDAKVRVAVRSKESVQRNLKACLDKLELVNADLLRLEDSLKVVHGCEVVFNLAGDVGGIGFNSARPGTAFTPNAMLNLMLLEASRLENIERYECTSSTCVYSREKSSNAKEEDAFLDDPEPTVLGYGWAKRVAELQARFYAKEYGMKIAIVRPGNTYGPRDNFDALTSHVIPALIRRIFESNSRIDVWGSGDQTRTFIYVQDTVRGLMDTVERYSVADPINLGTNEEIRIADLTRLIIRLSGRDLSPNFDLSRPEGQSRKFADITKAQEKIGWRPEFTLKEGLKNTISWYKETLLTP